MPAHPYRISVAKLENDTEQHLMTFDVENHDEIEKVLAHLQKKLPVSSAEQQAFAVIHTRKNYYQLPHQPSVDALILQRVYD